MLTRKALPLFALVTLAVQPAFAKCKFVKVNGSTSYFQELNDKDAETQNTVKIENGFFGAKFAYLGTGGAYSLNKPIKAETVEELKKDCEGKGIFPDWHKIDDSKKAQLDRFTATQAAHTLAMSDINGDGIFDYVIISSSPSGIAVQLGRADGTFANAVRYPTAPGAEALELLDLNGDHIKDAIVANAGNFGSDTGKVSVLIGNANGTFGAATHFAAGIAPRALAIDDFNGDTKLDLAVGNAGTLGSPNLPANSGDVSILLGNGNGTFQPASRVPAGAAPASVLSADFNNDKKLDLAVANRESGNISILLGNGNATFQAPANVAIGDRPNYLGAADFNGDNVPDLGVFQTDSSTLTILFGNGDGTFRFSGRYLGGTNVLSFGISYGPTDIRPTIVMPSGIDATTMWMMMNLDGSLLASSVYPLQSGTSGIATGDFDGDGKPDVVATDRGGLKFLRGLGNLTLEEARSIAIDGAPGAAYAMTSSDFNGDSKPDLAIVNALGRISILTGNGTGGFQSTATLNASSSIRAIVTADLNRDNRPDLVTVDEGSTTGSIAVYLNNGTGGFLAPVNYGVGSRPKSVAVGDLNGDGRPDLAVTNYGITTLTRGSISLFLTNADGTLRTPATIDAGESPESAAISDFNNDGRMDLAYIGIAASSPNYIFRVTVLPGNGNGTFGTPIHRATNLESGTLIAGDFNGDGNQDLIAHLCCGSTGMLQLLGNGDSTFREAKFVNGGYVSGVATADFNVDGRPDIAVLNSPISVAGYVAVIGNSLWPVDFVSTASYEDGSVAPDSIVSAFGNRLANATGAATSENWPTSLAGTTVRLRDSSGIDRAAQISYASNGQVNFVLPKETAEGKAAVTITSGANVVTQAPIGVRRVSPGLFFVNTNLAAALLVRVRAGGEQVVEQVVQLSGNQLVPLPIDFGPDSDQLVLLLFGTGIRQHNGQVSATIGGISTTVNYAGPQNFYPGLDQVNLPLPRTLRGKGLTDVQLTVEGIEANLVRVQFR